MKTRLDGLSLLELVRRDYSGIPVRPDDGIWLNRDRNPRRQRGTFDYISKPFNIDELVAIARLPSLRISEATIRGSGR